MRGIPYSQRYTHLTPASAAPAAAAAAVAVAVCRYQATPNYSLFCRATVSFVLRVLVSAAFLARGQGAFYILSYPLVEFLNQGSSKLLTFDNEVCTPGHV